MGVVCQFLIRNPPKGVFYSGQPVTGVVKYVIDKPTEYREVTLSLLGTGECKWKEYYGRYTKYYCGTENYVTTTINILQQTSPTTLQAGTYEYPFQFRLPENIPSTFKSNKCTIKYQILMKFERTKIFSFSKKFNTEITVVGLLRSKTEPVPFVMQKSLFKPFSSKEHKIYVCGEIAKLCVSPGEQIQILLQVINNSDTITKIRVQLYRLLKLTDDGQNTLKRRNLVSNCYAVTGEIAKRSEMNIPLTVPTRPELYTIQCKILKIQYMLKVVILMPGLHCNSAIEVPVVIGKIKGLENNMAPNAPTCE